MSKSLGARPLNSPRLVDGIKPDNAIPQPVKPQTVADGPTVEIPNKEPGTA